MRQSRIVMFSLLVGTASIGVDGHEAAVDQWRAAISSEVSDGEDWRESRRVRGFFVGLLEDAHWGFSNEEVGAFLYRDVEGTVQCFAWPRTGEFRQATFSGRYPSSTFAIVHTHPRKRPKPSPRDQDLARELGVPIIVITPEKIWEATGDGGRVRIESSRWVDDLVSSECR